MNPDMLFHLNKLKKNQWLSEDVLREIQLKKLQHMIKYAYENVRYYRFLFDSVKLRPEDIRTLEDLASVPITKRQQFQSLPKEEIVSKKVSVKKCKHINTAGSSGMPLIVYMTKKDSSFYDMVWARTSLANGRMLRDRTVYFKYNFPPKNWFEYLGVWRKYIISLVDGPLKNVETLRTIKPDIIRGNSYQLINVAHVILSEGIQDIRPRLVFSMGSLLDKRSRQILRKAFHAQVFDFYGVTEVGCIAWECPEHQGYHINIDTTVVEVVNQEKPVLPGRMGRIICTGLHSFAMPFIRYDIGDVGVLADTVCRCGRGLPLLKSIEGRKDDFLRTMDGNPCSPSVIVNETKRIPGIRHFRIIQQQEDMITALFVKDNEFSQDGIGKFKGMMKRILGEKIRVDVQLVGNIPPDPSGKIRSVISEINTKD